MSGKTAGVLLVEGDPTDIFLAEISDWTDHVLVAPRCQLDPYPALLGL